MSDSNKNTSNEERNKNKSESVTIQCVSEPYIGVPVEVEFSNLSNKITSSDWSGLYTPSGSRIMWEWMQPSLISSVLPLNSKSYKHTFRTAVSAASATLGPEDHESDDDAESDGESVSETTAGARRRPSSSRGGGGGERRRRGTNGSDGYAPSVTLECRLYRNGGWLWFAEGTLVGKATFTLQNPLENVSAVVGEAGIEVSYTIKTRSVAAKSVFTLTTEDGVRVAQVAMELDSSSSSPSASSTLKGKIILPLPRVCGRYRINCLHGVDGSTVLWTGRARLESPANSKVYVSSSSSISSASSSSSSSSSSYLTSEQMRAGVSSGMLGSAVICGIKQPITVLVVPPAQGVTLTRHDKVFITKIPELSSSKSSSSSVSSNSVLSAIESSPAPRNFQTPENRLDISTDGVCHVTFSQKGVYHAALALRHPNGVFLPSGEAVIIVTDRGPQQQRGSSDGVSPLGKPVVVVEEDTSSSFSSSDDRGVGLCVVCCDRAVVMMVRPCNHVCLCERCEVELKEKCMLRQCPICRKNVSGSEKVYF